MLKDDLAHTEWPDDWPVPARVWPEHHAMLLQYKKLMAHIRMGFAEGRWRHPLPKRGPDHAAIVQAIEQEPRWSIGCWHACRVLLVFIELQM